MNYRDLQNISNLSQQILVEGANEDHNVLNRWPYTSPYLQESTELDEETLSTKAARAGKDIGEPGKNFSKIASSAANRYGSKEAGKRVAGAVLAKMRANEAVDLYDIILSHLLDEGYADTQEQAEVIMVNMSEDWRESICEGLKPRPEEKMQNKIRKNSQRWMKMHDIELGMPHARRLVDRNDKIRNNLFTPNSDRDAVYNKHRPEEGKRSKFISDNNAKKK
jgi:hypothetical protein